MIRLGLRTGTSCSTSDGRVSADDYYGDCGQHKDGGQGTEQCSTLMLGARGK